MRSSIARLRAWARRVLLELQALAHAARDPRTPWYARLLIVIVVAYALSPIDLIPDPIPVLGLLDDALLIPLGVVLARRLVPAGVLAEAREHVRELGPGAIAKSRLGAVLVIATWLALLVLAGWLLRPAGRD
jgi:uncharacterized membrane protein YkvA (DUF1232 family)